jgi:hypothetical protein
VSELSEDQLDVLRAVSVAGEEDEPVTAADISWVLISVSNLGYPEDWCEEQAASLVTLGLLERDEMGSLSVTSPGWQALAGRWPQLYA